MLLDCYDFFMFMWSLMYILVCVWEVFIYDLKNFFGDRFYEKKNWQLLRLKFCVSNGIVENGAEPFSGGREVIENIHHVGHNKNF